MEDRPPSPPETPYVHPPSNPTQAGQRRPRPDDIPPPSAASLKAARPEVLKIDQVTGPLEPTRAAFIAARIAIAAAGVGVLVATFWAANAIDPMAIGPLVALASAQSPTPSWRTTCD